jgi:hypothetical protein
MRNHVGKFALAAAIVLPGCSDLVGEQVIIGRGPVVYESRSVGSFTSVSNATLADVEIIQGTQDRVFVRAEENLLPYIRTRVEGGTLRIYTDGISLRPRERIVVEIDVRTLNRLESSGSGFVTAPLLDARRLEVVTSGAGDIELPSLLADSLIVISSGSGDVDATGNVTRLRLGMSGSGGVEMRELAALQADVSISGSGSAVIRVRDAIRATLSGSGYLRYYGSPTVQQTVTGSGRVERLGS